METQVYLTAADAEIFIVANQALGSLMAVTMTLVFGYLAGLYFFLHKTGIIVRLFAHTMVLIALLYVWVGFSGTIASGNFITEQFVEAVQAGVISQAGLQHYQNAGLGAAASGYTPVMWLTNIVAVFLVVALTYLAFFFNWRAHEGGK